MFIYKKKPFIILFLYVLFSFRNIDTMSIDTLSQEEDSREEQIKIINTLSQEELKMEELKRKQEVENTFELLENINLEPALEKKIIIILKQQNFFIFKYPYESFKKKIANIENVTFDQQIKIMIEIYYYYYSTQGKQKERESIDILYNELNIKELNQNLQDNTISILNNLTKEKIAEIKEKIAEITKDNKYEFLQSLEEKIKLIIIFIIQVQKLEKENKSSQYSKSINNLKQLFNQYFNLNPFINASESNKYILDIFYNTFRTDEDEDAKEYNLDYLIQFIYFLKKIKYKNNTLYIDTTLYYSDNEIEKDKVLIYCNKINSLHKILYKTSSNNLVNPKKIIEEWIDKLSIDTNQQTDQQTNQENQNKTNPLWYILIGMIIFVVSVLIYIFTKTKKPLPNEIIDDDLNNEVIKETK
jgi:hypothetical protein